MLACVCQPAETKLYKGGRATPIGPLGGPRRPLQRPRSLKSRPPKPPPKPNSYSTTSEDTKSSSSQQKSPKNLLSLKKIEQRSKSTKISSVCSSSKSDSDSQSIKQPLDNPFKPGDQEKLLKINVKPEKIEEPPPCNNVVTITDNDGKIYCVDNLILVGEDILGNIKNDYDDGVDDVSKKCPSYPSKGGLLTVKQKTDKDVEGSSSDGTNNYQVSILVYRNSCRIWNRINLYIYSYVCGIWCVENDIPITTHVDMRNSVSHNACKFLFETFNLSCVSQIFSSIPSGSCS